MEHLLELIRKREAPGILVLDHKGRLLYCNGKALEMIPGLMETDGKGKARGSVPAEIVHLCAEAEPLPAGEKAVLTQGEKSRCLLMLGQAARLFAVRAFAAGGVAGRKKETGCVMVLLEGVVEKHAYDFVKIKKKYQLSNRELDIIVNLCQGFSNREIAGNLYISEHTVKDHLKNIMAKMQVDSRNEILVELR